MSRLHAIKQHPAFRSWSLLPQMVCQQAGWWACVLWMGWWGPFVMLGFLGLHLRMTLPYWRTETVLILISTVLGIGLDNTLAALELVTYVGDQRIGFVPLWLVAIWAGFGATLRHSQQVFVHNIRNAALTGFLGGPMAYLGGEKLERLTVHGLEGWIGVSLLWGVALLTLYWATKHQNQKLQ